VRYLKLFEVFVETMPKRELSDKTIDDVLKPGFFDEEEIDEEEIEDKGSTIDSNGVIHIKNWNTY
jgi:hypothetical protein